ncbi:MAG: thioredoxin domain-containing protein [Candidatus Competibacteraceae bacterium]
MNKTAGAVAVLAVLVIGAALVAGSLLVRDSLDRQTAAIAGVQEALKTLNQSVQASAAAKPAPAAARRGPDPAQRYTIAVNGSPVRGQPDAKVTLVEFMDFQCPFCARVQPTLQQIRETYGDQVRVVFKHLPLSFHPKAAGAAAAAEAAHRQGKFWEMQELIFANQSTLDDEHYRAWAQQLGLDVAQWEKDRQSPEVLARVAADAKDAEKLGVSGTPAFFVNGRFLSGAQPFASFKNVIDQEIGKPVALNK